jgi:hypothetical protein
VALDVGARTLAIAHRMVQQVVQGVAPGGVPRCLIDGFTEDTTALLTHVGPGVSPPRRHAAGPAPTPRWRPRPALLEAQMAPSDRRGHAVAAADAGDGRGVDRARLAPAGGAAVSGTAGAATPGAVSGGGAGRSWGCASAVWLQTGQKASQRPMMPAGEPVTGVVTSGWPLRTGPAH